MRIFSWDIIRFVVNPFVRLKEIVSNWRGGPVAFLSKEDRRTIMSHEGIKEINGNDFYPVVYVTTTLRYPNKELVTIRVEQRGERSFHFHDSLFNSPMYVERPEGTSCFPILGGNLIGIVEKHRCNLIGSNSVSYGPIIDANATDITEAVLRLAQCYCELAEEMKLQKSG